MGRRRVIYVCPADQQHRWDRFGEIGIPVFFGTTHSILQVSYSKVKDKLKKRINEYMNREG